MAITNYQIEMLNVCDAELAMNTHKSYKNKPYIR